MAITFKIIYPLVCLFLPVSILAQQLDGVQQLTPAPIENYKPLPQFQFNGHVTHWYAIDNENNPTYWENVIIDRILICLRVGTSESTIQPLIEKYGLLRTKDKSMFPDMMNFFVYHIPNSSKERILQIIREAQHNANIEFAEPEAIIKVDRCYGNDPYNFPNSGWKQWAPDAVGADSVWCTFTKSSLHWIGIIDNAVDYSHTDLNVYYGHDFADNDTDPKPDPTGKQTHGTHVSGIAGAKINNAIGVAGISNDTIYFAKAVKNYDTLFDNTAIINAINDMAVEPKVRVVNMSFSAPAPTAAIQTACDNAYVNGKLLIAAAGNNASSAPFYPAGYSSVMSVGSIGVNPTTLKYQLSSFSNYGTKQELTAPGGNNDGSKWDIWSTLPSNNYGYMAGTSMAAPVVTGVAELVFDIRPSLTNVQVKEILDESIQDLGTAGRDDYFGYGMICAWCAVINAVNYIPHTEVQQVPNDNGVNIYPNPNKGLFTISLPNNTDKVDVSIFNVVGQIICNYNTVSATVKVDLSNQTNGIYFIKTTIGQTIFNNKVVVEK